MPAALPGSTLAQNLANPSLGRMVLLDPLSGPKGSPLDNDKQRDIITGDVTASGNASTGALSTGIGFGSPPVIVPASVFADIDTAGSFTDDYIPGLDLPAGTTAGSSAIMYAGGGRSVMSGQFPVAGVDGTDPYTAGVAIAAAGNGGSRDGGAGPAFTGFSLKTVTATGAVANGAAVETGFVNRSGIALVAGDSVFGSATATLGAPS